ncbi:MAG: hypothetical protein HQ565_12035 [Bacteroidetes bacterium]|nr:hypothetical protein [Bacteroidota bacterium]
MTNRNPIIIEEPFLQQEIILGMLIGVGMLLMVVSEVLGKLVVMVAVLSVTGIYITRLYKVLKEKGEAIHCCFACCNNGAMILAVAGILLLMLINTFQSQVFFSGLALLSVALLLNSIFLRYNIRGMTHITAQIRLLIAIVVMVVFFLL